MIKIGIIGGTGLDDSQLSNNFKEIELETPFGKPSSPLKTGKINDCEVILLARHGLKHQFSPSEVNYKANIYALKNLGATHIIATTACGSLKEEIGRGDFVIIDQFIDFTKIRKNTFFDSFSSGIAHTPMATPFDNQLRNVLYSTAIDLENNVHKTGTVITVEGPRFSTKAESNMFRSWGADIINMSVATEVILANELKIPYGAIAISTDYDCWKDDEESVSWEAVLEEFQKNIGKVKNILTNVLTKIK